MLATKTALTLSDYVVTEAGFGADLGAEKFIDIKCRKSGLRPQVVVIVATIRALKYHGGVEIKELNTENLDALSKGVANLERHVNNIRNHYGLPCICERLSPPNSMAQARSPPVEGSRANQKASRRWLWPLSRLHRQNPIFLFDRRNLRGVPSGHEINIREVRLAAGAQFVVMVCGEIMTMPGLPKVPAATKMISMTAARSLGFFSPLKLYVTL